MGMLLLVLVLNLVISFFNARNVGKIWAESKAIGGWVRVLAWAGAIQSAVGFTYVYAVVVAYIAASTGYLPASMVGVLLNLMYVMLVVPMLGSAIIITIQSWINAARERSLMNLGVAGWNTFATAYNAYNAVNSFGPALDAVQEGLGGLFGGDSDSDDNAGRVILLAAIVLLAGVLTTSVIIRRYEATLPVSEEVRNATRDLEYR